MSRRCEWVVSGHLPSLLQHPAAYQWWSALCSRFITAHPTVDLQEFTVPTESAARQAIMDAARVGAPPRSVRMRRQRG